MSAIIGDGALWSHRRWLSTPILRPPIDTTGRVSLSLPAKGSYNG
jgi:hypothetical protein